ncbi:transcriptional regulator [Erwinia phage AH03]|uniref:Transcriptional regulator n=1 Tax=Erwinia phage AH03 TaxID=2869568 RepID=A0AAE7X0B9_9CAUD|nr:transcriptional regulator [Erwinia phage AH03]
MKIPKTKPGWLYVQTLKLIEDRPRKVLLEDIAEQACVSRSWLMQLISKKITDPSANRLEAVYNVLADKPLGE